MMFDLIGVFWKLSSQIITSIRIIQVYNVFVLQVIKRGSAPDGGGEVLFTCPCKQKLRPLQFTDPGKVKRVRGIAYPF